MRRALAGLLSPALVAIAAQVAIAASSAAPLATAVIVCPLERAGPIPCCGPPVVSASAVEPICCPVPTSGAILPCFARLTIASTPDPSAAGARVTITGTVGGGLAITTAVALWQELPGQQSFHQVASTRTDSSGGYKFVRGPIETNRRWYAVAGDVRSSTVSQQVTALVTISAPATTAKAGRSVTFTGRVTPKHSGEKVVLEERFGRAWRIIESAKIDNASTYVVRAAFTHVGRVNVRTVLPADSRNARSTSPVVTLTIA